MPHIITEHVYPPIPVRSFDWCAYFDGDEESGPRGWGTTEEAAIADLHENAADYPKRCTTNIVGQMGECLLCDADSGEACRTPKPTPDGGKNG